MRTNWGIQFFLAAIVLMIAFWSVIVDFLIICVVSTLAIGAIFALKNLLSDIAAAYAEMPERRIELQRLELENQRTQIENQRLLMDAQLITMDDSHVTVPREEIMTGQYTGVAFNLLSQRIDAQRTHAPVPNTIHYKPSWKESDKSSGTQGAVEEQIERFISPKFRVLYNNDEFPTNGTILLGYTNDGQKQHTEIAKFYSAIISGASRKGKSSLVRYCLLQHLMQSREGIDLLMCDPHSMAGEDSLAHSLEPLRHMFLSDVARTEEEILGAAQYAESIGQKRIDGDPDRKPLMLIIDEVSLLLDGSDIEKPLGHCLKRIGREFAKVGVITMIMGQQFGGNVISTSTRNCFTRVLSCPNVRDNLGRMIPSSALKQVETLEVGQFIDFEVGGGTQILNFPETTSEDVAYVAGEMGGGNSFQTASKPLQNPFTTGEIMVKGKEISPHSEGVLKEISPPISPPNTTLEITELLKRFKIKSMIESGAKRTAIIKEIWGVTGGKAYTKAKNELDSTIEIMKANGEF